jgi:hypothetical protein
MDKKIPTFFELIEDTTTPVELVNLLEKCKTIPQTLQYHPELFVFKHIQIVYDRCLNTDDIDLVISAFFHDLGKVETTKPHLTKPDVWPAHGHELVSTKLVEKYRVWIVQKGANFNTVHFIVKNHMRMNIFNDMRKSKQDALRQHPDFDKLELFTKFDDMINYNE